MPSTIFLLLAIFALPALVCPVVAYQLGRRLGRPAVTIWVGICFLPLIPAIIMAARLLAVSGTHTAIDTALALLFASSIPALACIPGLVLLKRAKRSGREDPNQLGFSPSNLQQVPTQKQKRT